MLQASPTLPSIIDSSTRLPLTRSIHILFVYGSNLLIYSDYRIKYVPEECSCEKPDGKCICIEEGGIRYESFIDTVSTLANLTMEGVIAELIDNSLDEDATNVEIEFVGKTENNSQ